MKKKSLLLAGAACAACCAPLVWPFLVAAGIGSGASVWAGTLFGLNPVELLCIAALVFAATGLFLLYRKHSRGKVVEGASCDIDGACAPQASQRKGA